MHPTVENTELVCASGWWYKCWEAVEVNTFGASAHSNLQAHTDRHMIDVCRRRRCWRHQLCLSDGLLRPPQTLSGCSSSAPPVPACSSRDLSEVIHTKWDSFPSGINLLRVTPQLIRHSCSASTAHRDTLRDFLISPSLTFRWPLWFLQNRSTILTLHLILGQDFNLLRDLFPATFLDKVQIALCSQDFNSQGKVRLASSN